MIIQPPKTIEDFEAIKETILELIANPYCDKSMLSSLNKRLDKTNEKINELKTQ